MPKDKERAINPAAAARKAEKAKALKKGKATVAQQRNARLAKQNPHRIQSQIDDLKALEANHSIKPHEKKHLDELERELARVVKAKEAAGGKYVPRTNTGSAQNEGQNFGRKRPREEQESHGRRSKRIFSPESSATDEDVGDIPMPRDTPPPIPRRRREDGPRPREVEVEVDNTPEKVESVPSQAVYESKPVMRDLRKEAAAFVPAAVRKRQVDGASSITSLPKAAAEQPKQEAADKKNNEVDGISDKDLEMADLDFQNELRRLEQADNTWRREAKQATVEEVMDEDA